MRDTVAIDVDRVVAGGRRMDTAALNILRSARVDGPPSRMQIIATLARKV